MKHNERGMIMTLKEIKRYRTICAEIKQIDKKLNRGKIHVRDSVKTAAKPPYHLHNVSVEGDVYVGSSPSLLSRKAQLISDKNKIEDFVEKINDYDIKRAIEIYCMEPSDENLNLPDWEDVADYLGKSTGEAVRKSVERFLKKKY